MSIFLPETSDEVCLFGIYVGLQLLCSGLTILGTVMSLHLYHKDSTDTITVIYREMSRLFCQTKRSSCHTEHKHMNGQTLIDDDPSSRKSTGVVETTTLSWVDVALAFDRMCFWLSVFWNMALIVGLVYAFRS